MCVNRKTQNIEIAQKMESFICKYLNDEVYCKYHTAILGLVSACIETESLLLSLSLYRRYKSHVIHLNKLGQVMKTCEEIEKIQIKETYEIRRQIDADYYILCLLIISTYERTTFPEEKEVLRKLINGIKRIMSDINEILENFNDK